MKIKKKYQINKKIILKKKQRKKISQKQNKRCIEIRDLIRSYAELEIKLKAMEQNFKRNDSENNKNIHKRNLFKITKTKLPDKQN